jgi:hypothetical protein
MKRLNSQLQYDDVPMPLIVLIRSLLAACKEISFRINQGALTSVHEMRTRIISTTLIESDLIKVSGSC